MNILKKNALIRNVFFFLRKVFKIFPLKNVLKNYNSKYFKIIFHLPHCAVWLKKIQTQYNAFSVKK